MFRNFKMVSNVVYGRGSFNQLDDILAVNRKTSESFMVFLVDDVFLGAALKGRVPVATGDLLLWVNVDEEPTTAYVDELTEKVRASSGRLPTGVVGIGGGATMDLA
ncbi:MAG: iron-containing alcohol dehydrogenase, partial [Desulfobulbaceae bacterium]|nr:iron-containing alcohol dehydrogenase [Desulfobulbaceae bacterium]